MCIKKQNKNKTTAVIIVCEQAMVRAGARITDNQAITAGGEMPK